MGFLSEATQSSPLSFSQINDLPKGQEKTFCAKKVLLNLPNFRTLIQSAPLKK